MSPPRTIPKRVSPPQTRWETDDPIDEEGKDVGVPSTVRRTLGRAGGKARRLLPLAAALLLAALLAIPASNIALAQAPPDELTLVNADRDFVERKKRGEFVARPVFDREIANLFYAVRDADTGDWIRAMYGAPPVRVEDAHPAIVSKRDFQKARRLLGSRAPKKVNPRRASSPYLLSGIAKCETCGKAMTAAEAKSGKYTYYICHPLLKRGKGTCDTPRLNAKNFEKLIVNEIRENVLTESNIRDLVKLLDEEMDGVAREQRERLESIDGELEEVKNQLGRVWHFIARSDSVDVAEASDLIVELRGRKEKLEIATEEARALLKERRQFLDSADTIAAFAAEMSEFLKTSELTETKAFVGSFVKEVVVKPGRAAIVYSIPTPDDSPMGGADAAEIALNGRVMNSVRHGGACGVRTRDLRLERAVS